MSQVSFGKIAHVIFIHNICAGPRQRFQQKLFAEVCQGDAGVGAGPAQVTHEGAQRTLAIVAGRAVQECGLIPRHIGPDDGTQNLPEQIGYLRVIRQAGNPALHVPIGVVVRVVYHGVDGVRNVVHAGL